MSDLERFAASLDLKAVDPKQRLISGHAAVFGNLDRNGDIIETGAFKRTLTENPDVIALIGHNLSSLPVGEPRVIREDAKGLYTETYVYETAAGNDLLAVAAARHAQGKPLGMSIGYRTKTADGGVVDGEYVRKLLDLDLAEYSFLASPILAANPEATTLGVKAAVTEALEDFKAEWTAAFINDLPDSSFAVIEAGGTKDDAGKTTPRSLRHFPHHGADGAVDLPHLRNALSRAPQSPLGDRALPHLKRHASAAGVGEAAARVADDLVEAFEEVADELEQLGAILADHEEKAGARLNSAQRESLRRIAEALGQLQAWADHADDDTTPDDEPKAAAAFELTPHADPVEQPLDIETRLARAQLEARLASMRM